MSVAQLRRSHNARHQLAPQVASALSEFEGDLSRALASGGRLLTRLPEARTAADLSATVGATAISHIVASILKVSEAMNNAVEGHSELAKLAKHLRVEVTAGGDKPDIPPPSG